MTSDITIAQSKIQDAASFYGVKGSNGGKTLDKTSGSSSVSSAIKDTVSLSSPHFLEKISQVQGFLEKIASNEDLLTTTFDNIDTISAKLEEAGGVAVRIREGLRSSVSQELLKPQVESLRARFADIISDIDNISNNSGFPDENLLAGDTVSFAVDPVDRTTLDIEGVELSSAQLGLIDIQFKTDNQAEFVKNIIAQAVDQVAVFKSQLNAVSYELETRKIFSQDTIDIFLDEAQKENNAGNNDEAGALMALRSRTLSNSNENLALEAQFELLEHFR